MGGLPEGTVEINVQDTARVITDPQNDFLSPKGVTWAVVGESVTENNTVENIESLLKAAKKNAVMTTKDVVEAMEQTSRGK